MCGSCSAVRGRARRWRDEGESRRKRGGETHELTVDVPADGDGTLDGLDVRFVHQDLARLFRGNKVSVGHDGRDEERTLSQRRFTSSSESCLQSARCAIPFFGQIRVSESHSGKGTTRRTAIRFSHQVCHFLAAKPRKNKQIPLSARRAICEPRTAKLSRARRHFPPIMTILAQLARRSPAIVAPATRSVFPPPTVDFH